VRYTEGRNLTVECEIKHLLAEFEELLSIRPLNRQVNTVIMFTDPIACFAARSRNISDEKHHQYVYLPAEQLHQSRWTIEDQPCSKDKTKAFLD
jgi:hypothetical protein